MDSDTPQKLRKRASYMRNCPGIDVMQTAYLTPLPGTRLYDQYVHAQRLRYTDYPADWQHYDMTEVIYQPQQMTWDELKSLMKKRTDRCTPGRF